MGLGWGHQEFGGEDSWALNQDKGLGAVVTNSMVV